MLGWMSMGIVLGYPGNQWIGLDCGRDNGCPWIVLEHPEDQWIGLDCGRDTVFGWMSMD